MIFMPTARRGSFVDTVARLGIIGYESNFYFRIFWNVMILSLFYHDIKEFEERFG